MMRNSPPLPNPTAAVAAPGDQARRGTSLSEVLVATLVMSIGVVSLATLFPISILRSIQASQLTNATNLRYNAEAQVRAIPELFQIGQEWLPATTYSVGAVVTPTAVTRRELRAAVYVCTTAGLSGTAEPAWDQTGNVVTNDGTAVWSSIPLKNYIIDPLGFVVVDPNDANGNYRGAVAGARQHFGNVSATPFLSTVNRFPAFNLFNPSDTAANNELRAASAVVLPDSWEVQADSLELANLTATSLDLSDVNAAPIIDLLSSVGLTQARLVLFDLAGRRSHVLSIANVVASTASGTTVSWPASQGVPTGFFPGRARIETLDRRYSYLLSVRRSFGGNANIDCVVFFRRSFTVADEQVYSCEFRKIDGGLDLSVTTDDQPRNFCILQYDSGADLTPFFKKGGYICDARNLRWYRIVDVAEGSSLASVQLPGFQNDTADPNADRFVRLTLDQNIQDDSLGTTTVGGTPVVGGAILMRGIVDVFALPPRN